jgi:transcriptional regulator of acetoin/glycerol metabolism
VSSGRLELDHLPEGVFEGMGLRAPLSSDEEMQARLVKLLDQHRGNVSAVATLMRTSRSQIHRWMKRFGIEPMPFRQ